VSIRRACKLLSVARPALRCESELAKRDAPVRVVLRELAAQYPRFGRCERMLLPVFVSHAIMHLARR
jgi:hypothetical protein